MSAQKRRGENEKKKDWRCNKERETSKQPRASTSHDDNGDDIITLAARRASVYIFRKGVHPINYLRSLALTVSATTKSSLKLKCLGVTYARPDGEMNQLMDVTRAKRDRLTLSAKRLLQFTVSEITSKYSGMSKRLDVKMTNMTNCTGAGRSWTGSRLSTTSKEHIYQASDLFASGH